ncbi:hypothetical protein LCGC14_2001310 [marine sediment metagenome]|uniref:Uncharacterized protein n=1 Tax=marine sediment metagenome TaxID=412755 RepID=A0A0F9FQU9_9ZZZZ
MPKLNPLKDGEWVYLKMSGYLFECCDCGLTHKLDFIVASEADGHILNGVEIALRAYRVDKRKPAKKKKKP